jgi:hypothetical protein
MVRASLARADRAAGPAAASVGPRGPLRTGCRPVEAGRLWATRSCRPGELLLVVAPVASSSIPAGVCAQHDSGRLAHWMSSTVLRSSA